MKMIPKCYSDYINAQIEANKIRNAISADPNRERAVKHAAGLGAIEGGRKIQTRKRT